MKGISVIIGLTIIVVCALFLYHNAQIQSTYEGLPTVPCLDYTKPVVQSFSFSIQISIQGQQYPLDKSIGHDFGNCLHDMYVNDASGDVFVQANDTEVFTLGQFFDVWHKTFTPEQIFGYQVRQGHMLEVFVNGKKVDTYRKTIVIPNEKIEVRYK